MPTARKKPREAGAKAKERSRRRAGDENAVLLYGRHAVRAALANPRRRKRRLYATEEGLKQLEAIGTKVPAELPVQLMTRDRLAALLDTAVPHQGCVLEAAPLSSPPLEALMPQPGEHPRVLVLDRVEDPRNLGAILRSAALLGARGVVTTARHAPRESGALARAAAGALDVISWIRVPNLARALKELAEMGYWRVGLSAAAVPDEHRAMPARDVPLAVVLGAEGSGLRPLTRRHLDWELRLAMPGANALLDSLNVSVAAALALWTLRPPAADDTSNQPDGRRSPSQE
ncbi:MAG: RNA methyltransferase [Alphaproteobacteria bacterium]|nr:MAG: RNA methyltransferase [Alphaproteobacteria bacterium]